MIRFSRKQFQFIVGRVIDGRMNNSDKYITIKELADLKGVGTRAIRLTKDKYQTREIMLEENTQCVVAALRNAILNLKHIPKFVYLDNGKAFKNNYFKGYL